MPWHDLIRINCEHLDVLYYDYDYKTDKQFYHQAIWLIISASILGSWYYLLDSPYLRKKRVHSYQPINHRTYKFATIHQHDNATNRSFSLNENQENKSFRAKRCRVPCKRKLLWSSDYFNDSNHFNLSIPHREYTDGMGSESPDGWCSTTLFSPILIYKHLSLIKRPTRQIYET